MNIIMLPYKGRTIAINMDNVATVEFEPDGTAWVVLNYSLNVEGNDGMAARVWLAAESATAMLKILSFHSLKGPISIGKGDS